MWGKKFLLLEGERQVEIFFKGNLIETHQVVKSAHQAKSTKKHHLKPHEQIMQDNDRLLEKAKKIGDQTEEMIRSILMRGRGYVDTRSVWGILSLDKDYGKEQINKACRYALECEQLGYQSVMRFINVMPKEEKLIEKSAGNKFTRDPSEYGVQLDFLN